MADISAEDSQKKKKLFCDLNDEESKELISGFDKALKNKAFRGEKGAALLNLQNSYIGDDRFKISSKFKDDFEYKKLPKFLRKSNKKYSFDYDNDNENKASAKIKENDEDENIIDLEAERKRNLSILSSILPNEAFIGHRKVEQKTQNLIIKRYDPGLKLQNQVEASKDEIKDNTEIKEIKSDKNVIKLDEGIEFFKQNKLEDYKKNKNNKPNKKDNIEFAKELNRINDNMNQEIKINYDSWKKGILEKNDTGFSMFGNNTSTQEDNKAKENKISKESINNQLDNNEGNIKTNGDPVDKKEDVNDDKKLLKKKRREEREKEIEKLKIEKRKKEHKKKKQMEKIEKINKEYIEHLKQTFGEEKVSNYVRYLDMIKDSKRPKHKKDKDKKNE